MSNYFDRLFVLTLCYIMHGFTGECHDFVVLGLVSSVTRQDIGPEERLCDDLFASNGT